MKNLLVGITLALSLSSCSHALDAFVGQPYNTYVAKNGPSHRSATLGNGLTVHTYESWWANNGFGSTCIITLQVDEQNIIKAYNSEGC